MHYPILFTEDEGEIVVSSRHFPELITSGRSKQEALEMAEDALTVALLTYIEQGTPLPEPDAPLPGEIQIHATDEVEAVLGRR